MSGNLLTGEYYKEKVIQQFHHILNVLDEIKRILPPFGPRRFADALEKIIENFRIFYDYELKNLASATEEEVIARSKKYLAFLAYVHRELFPYLEGIDSVFIPSELILSFRSLIIRIADKLNYSTDFELCFYPIWGHNYECHIFKNLLDHFLKEFIPLGFSDNDLITKSPLPSRFIFINYPRMECRNALLHSLIMHEIGHYIEYEGNIRSKLMGKIELHKDNFEDFVLKTKEHLEAVVIPGVYDDQKIRQQLHQRCSEITSNWLTELICDLIAVRIFGPAYFFSFLDLTLLTDIMHKNSETHPSSEIRLRFILNEIVEMGYLTDKAEEKLKDIFDGWNKYFETKRTEINDPSFLVGYSTITNEQNSSHLRSEIKEQTKEFLYDVARFNNEVHELKELLLKGIPPADIWDAKGNNLTNFISILNAGWLIYKTKMGKFYSLVRADDSEIPLAFDNFNDLLLKAIEGSEILCTWRDV